MSHCFYRRRAAVFVLLLAVSLYLKCSKKNMAYNYACMAVLSFNKMWTDWRTGQRGT